MYVFYIVKEIVTFVIDMFLLRCPKLFDIEANMHFSTFFSILTFIFWGIAALIFFYVIPKIERNSEPFDKEKEIEVKVWHDVMGYAIIIGIVCSVFSSTGSDD